MTTEPQAPDYAIDTETLAALTGQAPSTVRGWRLRKSYDSVLPYTKDRNGKVWYDRHAVEEFAHMLRPATGEMISQEEFAKHFPELARKARLKTASRLLRRVVEILGDPALEMDMPADVAAHFGNVEAGEHFGIHRAGVEDLLTSMAGWLWDWSEDYEPGVTDDE